MRVTNKLEWHLSVEEEKRMHQVYDDDFSFSNLPKAEQEISAVEALANFG